jgi:hypothetical protein
VKGEIGSMTGTDLDLIGLGLDGEGTGGSDRGWVDFGIEMVDFEGGYDEGGDLVVGDPAREGEIEGFPEERNSDETGADAASLRIRKEKGKGWCQWLMPLKGKRRR